MLCSSGQNPTAAAKRAQTGEKATHSCEQCGKTFSDKNNLQRHIRKHDVEDGTVAVDVAEAAVASVPVEQHSPTLVHMAGQVSRCIGVSRLSLISDRCRSFSGHRRKRAGTEDGHPASPGTAAVDAAPHSGR